MSCKISGDGIHVTELHEEICHNAFKEKLGSYDDISAHFVLSLERGHHTARLKWSSRRYRGVAEAKSKEGLAQSIHDVTKTALEQLRKLHEKLVSKERHSNITHIQEFSKDKEEQIHKESKKKYHKAV